MKEKIKHDKFGRIIIEDEKLLKEISGATNNNRAPDGDGACGNDVNCNNTNCSDV